MTTDNVEDDFPLSKTQRKQQAHELQKLGGRLVKLPDTRLAQLNLPETLIDAIREARRLKGFGAISRQMQYIGRLMRDIDADFIRLKFDEWDNGTKADTANMHRLERWRDRLIQEEAALAEFIAEHPGADLQHLRTLIRNARKEIQGNKPPKSAREIFRFVRDFLKQEDGSPTEEHPDE